MEKIRAWAQSLSWDSRALGLAILVIISFFVTRWVFVGAWFTNDLVGITTTLENLYANIQRSGQSPLWASELAGGYPLQATGQLGFWYPPHMFLRQFLPAVWTLNISLLLHSILAAAGTFIFLRSSKVNRVAAITAALLLPLGGAFVGKYEMINLILPYMWVPVLLLFLQKFLESGRVSSLFWWVLTNVLCILVGHPQMAVQILLLEAIFVVSLFILDWRRWVKALAVLAGVFLVVGLTSFYLLPIVDNLPATDRAQGVSEDAKEIFEFSFTLQALTGVVVPHPFGHGKEYGGPKNEAELSSYLGPLTILFVVVGLFFGGKQFSSIWLFSVCLVVIGIMLALGGQSPVYRWLVEIGWRYFGAPARFFLLADFGLVFLTALGIHAFASMFSQKYIRTVIVVLFVIGAVLPVLWVSWFWYEGVPWKYTNTPEAASILQKESGLVRLYSKDRVSDIAPDNDFGVMSWDPICSTCLYRQSFTSPFDTISGINLKLSRATTAGIIMLKLFNGSGEQLREASLETNDIVDGEWNNFVFPSLNNVRNSSFYFELTSNTPKSQSSHLYIHTNPNEQYDPTGTLSDCKQGSCTAIKAGGNTVDAAFALTTLNSQETTGFELLSSYIPAAYNIGSVQWAGSLGIRNVLEYLKPLGERSSSSAWQTNRSLINRFPITHVISLFPAHRYATNLINFTEVVSVPSGNEFIRIYKNHEAFPRVSFAEHVQAIAGSSNQKNAVLALGPQDTTTVVANLEGDSEFSSGTARITNDGNSRIVIYTKNTGAGFLVIRDVLLPGWKATIDGDNTPIYLTDSLFRGVIVPAGEHEVIFEYQPSWLRTSALVDGIAVSLLALLGYAAFKGFIIPNLPQKVNKG